MGNLMNLDGPIGIKYKLDKEIRTGDVWVDGKPIFRKTMHFVSNTIQVQKLFTIPNLDRVINIFGGGKNNGYQFMIGRTDMDGNRYSYFRVLNEDIYLVDSKVEYKDFYVTVLYTKSGGGN